MEGVASSTSELPIERPGDPLVPIIELSITLRAARKKARDFRRRLSHLAGELAREKEKSASLEDEVLRERNQSATLLRELDASRQRLHQAQLPLPRQIVVGDIGYLNDRIKYVEAALEWLRRQEKVPNECSICIEHYDHLSKIVSIPGCSHQFHYECIERWSSTFLPNEVTECPSCRQPFSLKDAAPAAWLPPLEQPPLAYESYIGPQLPPAPFPAFPGNQLPSPAQAMQMLPLLPSPNIARQSSRARHSEGAGSDASSLVGD